MAETWDQSPLMPKDLKLQEREVHVVWVSTYGYPHIDHTLVAYLRSVLTEEERARFARIREKGKSLDRSISRGVLRQILGGFLDIAPGVVPLRVGEQGKPFVEGLPLHFNVSHTQGLMAVAVSRDQEVGVDVERVKEDIEYKEMARSFFSAADTAAIAALDAGERLETFYRVWVRKEAVLKGMGKGIGVGLSRLEVPVGMMPARFSVDGWELSDLPVGTGYVGALAVCGGQTSVRYWSYVL